MLETRTPAENFNHGAHGRVRGRTRGTERPRFSHNLVLPVNGGAMTLEHQPVDESIPRIGGVMRPQRTVSSAARGLWMDMLSLMHEADPYGHLLINSIAPTPESLAKIFGNSQKETRNLLSELENAGVFSRTNDGIIYSRRMVRDHSNAARDTANGKVNGALGGNPEIRRGTVPKDERLRRFRRSDNPAKSLRIFNKDNGLCHWCRTPLEGVPWHADHVVAIADGGTNEDENLVAACPGCNHKRARNGWSDPNSSDPNLADTSDPNTQIPEARIQKLESEKKERTPYAPPRGLCR